MTQLLDSCMRNTLTPSESHWNAETQELSIDLKPLLGESIQLILSGWHSQHGIRWHNAFSHQPVDAVDNPTDQQLTSEWHTDPFAESLFPIEFIDHPILQPWRAQIPDELVTLLKRYKGNAFGLLMLCNQHHHIYQLFQHSPTLFWVCFTYARLHRWSAEQFIQSCRLPRIAMLKACFLPARKATINLLSKLAFKQFGRYEYDQIIQLLNLNFDKLNHRSVIEGGLIRFLIDYPELIEARLLRKEDDETIKPLSMLVNDIARMTGRLNLDTDAYIRHICHCSHFRQVQAIHDRLVKQLNASVQKLRTTARNSLTPNTVFPPPPLPGNQCIIPPKCKPCWKKAISKITVSLSMTKTFCKVAITFTGY